MPVKPIDFMPAAKSAAAAIQDYDITEAVAGTAAETLGDVAGFLLIKDRDNDADCGTDQHADRNGERFSRKKTDLLGRKDPEARAE